MITFQEYANIDTHVRALGQKYMGIRPERHAEEMFKDTAIHVDGSDHSVPISNFLNAQCMSPSAKCTCCLRY